MHHIVVGLGYGDEGKGTTTSYLCSTEPTQAVVRFSGGPQTLHNVILDDGTHHAFRQFGSGTLQGVDTITSRFALINPIYMAGEAMRLEAILGFNPMGMMYVSENAKLITEIHRRANRKREEARGGAAHGSCGHGIGETMLYATQYANHLLTKDILNIDVLINKMHEYKTWICQTFPELENINVEEEAHKIVDTYTNQPFNIITDKNIQDVIASAQHLVFEGTQGTLLDEWHGFHPHTTWSTTISKNAETLLKEAGVSRNDYSVVGITRTYGTRHGHGPFPTELENVAEQERLFPEKHNGYYDLTGRWRAGLLDLTTFEYAVKTTGGVDEIALTHCDVEVTELARSCISIPQVGEDQLDEMEKSTQSLTGATYEIIPVANLAEIVKHVETAAEAPVTIYSYGPKLSDKTTKMR